MSGDGSLMRHAGSKDTHAQPDNARRNEAWTEPCTKKEGPVSRETGPSLNGETLVL